MIITLERNNKTCLGNIVGKEDLVPLPAKNPAQKEIISYADTVQRTTHSLITQDNNIIQSLTNLT